MTSIRITILLMGLLVVFRTNDSFGQFNTGNNLVSNGDFEIGFIDDDPESPEFGFPIVQDWFRTANGFEDIFVGEDGSTGLQSVGYDTTGTLANQFNSNTWADWRAQAVAVTPGEALQWNFSYKSQPVAGNFGEIRAEMRAFDSDGAFSNAGTQILLLGETGAINQGSGETDDCTGRGDGWFDCTVELAAPLEADSTLPVTSYDLRYNNIFTTVSIAFEGKFQLDDVSIFRAGIEGDYNGNGVVDAADYGIWLANLGAFGSPGAVPGDGDDGSGTGTPDGLVNLSDYLFWHSRLGATTPLPGTALVGAGGNVPEPAGFLLAIAAVLTACGSRRLRI